MFIVKCMCVCDTHLHTVIGLQVINYVILIHSISFTGYPGNYSRVGVLRLDEVKMVIG